MDYKHISYEELGAVARICQARPQQRNAQSKGLLDELDAAMSRAAGDDRIRVVVLGGHGDHFSAGHDLKEAQAERSAFSVEERWAYEEKRYFEYCLRIRDLPKPTIAQVQGACVAGAFMVANMCDLLVASDDAYFSDPVAHTLAAAAVEVLVHPWVLGLRRSKEFLFTGERMSAAEAYRVGMVNRVVARQDLEAETLKLAERIAEAPPFGLRLLKRSLNRSADIAGFRSAVEAHFDTHQLSHVTQEFAANGSEAYARAIAKGKSSGG